MEMKMWKDKEFIRKLRALMIPIGLQSFMLAAVSAGDAAMLGFIDEKAMAAVSLAGNIQFVQTLFLNAIVCGVTILSAQYWGKGDETTVSRLFGLGIRYAMAVSVVFCMAAWLMPEKLMAIFTNEQALIAIGSTYIRIAALSYLIAGLTQCYLCVMKATGQTAQSASISSFALILDTVLNVIFIFGFHMGAAGAALTTTISRIAELAIALLFSRRMKVRPGLGRVSGAIHRDFLKCSVPHMINGMVWGFGTASYSVIIGHLGVAITAANSVSNIVRQLAISLCHGLAQGAEIILANVLGSGDLIKGREYGSRLAKLSVLCGIVCAVLALIFGGILSNVMTLSVEAREHLNVMIWFCAFYMMAQCINLVVICGVFAAGGDTAFDAYSVFVTMWLIIIPLAVAAGFWWKWHPIAVYIILSMDEAIKIPWVYHHYKKYKWLKNMTREETNQ